ncbi:adhesin [Acinetobacter sp. Tr-809]|uniref:ESPR-type extended signal peptide-containing protein n=1 Tax=Acinetobacter sp. Tr-809 TaxID=2608324 RepID=UPI0014207147|nr:ESPR-type extended signal peptide-containing protein [Acinetobacter sp. Tr-809]NIE97823.1 adhesin [Acinetobacter sp. Tr-809]
MNKVYKVVWNASIGAWVATSELAKSKTKTKSKVLNLSAAVLVGAISFSPAAFAGTVVGNGTNTPNKCNNSGSVIVGGSNTSSCANSDFAIAVGNDVQSTGRGSIAIGSGSRAESRQPNLDGKGAIAIGNDAIAYGDNSVAIGGQASTTEDFTVSFGHKKGDPKYYQGKEQGTWEDDRFLRVTNIAEGVKDNDAVNVSQLKSAVAEAKTHYVSINDNGTKGSNYENDGAKGRNSIAVGVSASATGYDAVVVGSQAKGAGVGAVSVGNASETVGSGDVAIGRNASTKGAAGTATSYSNQSIAIGDQTKAIGDQSVAIGADVIARGNSSVAIGGDDVDKIARDTELSQKYTEITGGKLQAGKYPTTETNHGSTAVGVQAVGTGAFASAFGMTSKATGDASSAFGVMSNAKGKGASAFGAVAQATGDGASAMGINSLASGTNSTAIGSGNKPGEGATATGNGAAAIGSNAKATGDNAAAVGKGAEASNENAAAIGGGAKASGKNSAAIGGGAVADQENAVAVGQGAQSMVVGGVALGARSRVEAENSVALGQDAIATATTGDSFLTNRDASMSNGVVSVGSSGKERRITNVEDGAADSDAVTVRQLKNVDSRVNDNAQNISNNAQNITNLNQKLDDTKTDLGNQIADTNNNLNDAKTDLGNQINNTKTELNTKIDNTKTELENKGLNFAGNAGADVHRKLGEKLNIVGGADASTAEDKTSGENVITRTTADGIKVELLKDAKFDSITTGDTVLSDKGVTIKDGPSITKDGINAGDKVISNVADGKDGKDAVNVDQLTKVKDGLDGKITDTNTKLDDAKKDLGNQITDTNNKLDDAKKDLGNQITDTKTELNNTINNTKTELNTKIDNTKTELENKGLNFAGNAGADVHRKLGEKLNIVGGADASTAEDKTSGENVITRTTADGIKVELLKDAKFDSITTGDTVLSDKGVTIKDGPSITKDGINAGDKVISNVADGKDGKDAVNVDQLTKVKDGLDGKITDTNTKLDDAKKDLGNQITDTNNKLDDAKKDLGNQITDTNNKLDDAKKDLGNQITDTKTELNNTINNTKTELNTKIDNTKTELENKGLNFAGNAGADVHRKLGEKLNIVGGADASTAEDKTSGENVITRTTKDGIQIELLKDAKFDSITTGDTVLSDKGVTIKDGPSITKDGINAGGKKITDVADGVNGKDAVNVDQLTKVKDGLDGKITDTNTKLDDAKKDLGNQITDTKTELNNTINNTKTELNTKIDNTKTELENKGLNFAGNAGADVHRKLGEKLNIVGGADASTAEDKTSGENVITRTTADGIKVELLKDAKFDSITTGDTVLNDKGVTIKDGPSITKDGINAGNKVISNVADGSIANGSKDAVNGGQVKNISDSIKNSIGGNTTVNPDGSITTNNIGGTGKDNVNDAIKSVDDKVTNGVNDLTNKGLNFAGNAGADVHRKLGEKLNIVGGADASTAEDKTSGENVITRTTADGIKVELLKDAKFDSITTGDTVLSDKGVTIKDGPSITKDGINAGDKVISNVADGKDGKDAVNVDQLTKVKDGLDGKITDTNTKLDDAKKDLGNQITDTNNKLDDAKKDLGNQITDTKTELNNTINNTKTELNTKIDNTKTELENKGLNFAGNAGADVHRKLGEKLNIVGGADASTAEDKTSGENVITRTTADGIKVELLKDAKFDSITTGDTVLNDKGVAIKDGPSITKDGINAGNKVISNVADGSIANGSKDAVNGGQIKNISDSIKNSIGGNTTVNPDGSITTNNIGGTGKDNINDAIKSVDDKVTNGVNDLTNKGLNFAGNAGADVHRKLGEKLNIVGGADASTAEDKTSGENVITRTTKDGIQIELLKDAKFDSITTGDTVLNDKGVTIKDGPSITKEGINAGNKVISNVADGSIATGSKDAVNGGQVKNISDSIKNSIGGNTTVNPDGSITTNNIGGTGKDNVNDAIKSVDDKVTNGVNDLTNKGLNFAGNAGADVHRKLGEKLNIVGGADASTAEDKTSGENVITRTTKDGIQIELLKDAKFDSITTGNTVINNNGLTIKGGPSITINGIDAGGKKITNVADGVDAKDAVNKGQLDKQINDVKDQIGKEIGDLSDNAVKYDKDKDGNVDKNSVTLGGGDKGTNLKNVADGKVEEGSKDAVNGGQLWDVQKQVDKNSNDIQNINNNINNINNGKSGLVQQQTPNGEITVGKDTGGTSINMAGKDGDRVVQGVKDGEIKAGSNQAVNGGQIHNISNSIKNSIGGETVVNQDGSITTNNIGGTGKNNINDAIGTLNQSNQELGNKINNLGDQLQQVFYDTNKRIDNLEDKMSAGIAATAALEQAPYVPGKLTMAVGAAYYNDQNAVGVTFRRTADNGRWSLTTGAALGSQGSPLVRIGVSTIID